MAIQLSSAQWKFIRMENGKKIYHSLIYETDDTNPVVLEIEDEVILTLLPFSNEEVSFVTIEEDDFYHFRLRIPRLSEMSTIEQCFTIANYLCIVLKLAKKER